MLQAVKLYYIVFALLTIAGGVIGYARAKSRASLIAGSICGISLLVAGLLIPEHPIAGLIVGIITSVSLAGKFVPDFMHRHAIIPAGLMALLSVVSIVLTVLAFKL